MAVVSNLVDRYESSLDVACNFHQKHHVSPQLQLSWNENLVFSGLMSELTWLRSTVRLRRRPLIHRNMSPCVFCVISNSHQRESPELSSPAWLRARIQPFMWLHLCPHFRVSTPKTNTKRAASEDYCSPFISFFLYVFFLSHLLQRTQQNPGVQFLPHRPGWLPPSLCG